MRLNAGNMLGDYNDGTNVWESDKFFNPEANSREYVAEMLEIANTDSPYLFQSERYDRKKGDDLTYTFPVNKAGRYRVTMYFAEIFETSAGSRVFNVLINGAIVLPALDIFAEVGYAQPLEATFEVETVGQEPIVASFQHITGDTKVSGFWVRDFVYSLEKR